MTSRHIKQQMAHIEKRSSDLFKRKLLKVKAEIQRAERANGNNVCKP